MNFRKLMDLMDTQLLVQEVVGEKSTFDRDSFLNKLEKVASRPQKLVESTANRDALSRLVTLAEEEASKMPKHESQAFMEEVRSIVEFASTNLMDAMNITHYDSSPQQFKNGNWVVNQKLNQIGKVMGTAALGVQVMIPGAIQTQHWSTRDQLRLASKDEIAAARNPPQDDINY